MRDGYITKRPQSVFAGTMKDGYIMKRPQYILRVPYKGRTHRDASLRSGAWFVIETIFFPFRGIMFDILHNTQVIGFIANNVVMIAFLP